MGVAIVEEEVGEMEEEVDLLAEDEEEAMKDRLLKYVVGSIKFSLAIDFT